MRGALVPLTSLVALISGCAFTPPPPTASQTKSVEYREPNSPPRAVSSTVVNGTPRELIDGALNQLNDDRYEVSLADAERGLFIVTYSGGAENYLDCGEFRLKGESADAWRDSAARQVTLSPFQRYPDWIANREMQLDARIVTELSPSSDQTEVKTNTTYVLTQMVDVIDGEGTVRGATRETIDFGHGRSGRFTKGTVCNPNGELERQVASFFDASAATVASNAIAPSAPQPITEDVAVETAAVDTDAGAATGAAAGVAAGAAAAIAGSEPAPEPEEPTEIAAVQTRQQPSSPARSLNCADVNVAQTGTRGIVITGVVASDQDRQSVVEEARLGAPGENITDELSLLPPGGCDAIELADSMGTGALPNFAVKLEGNADVLTEGSTVDLDVTLPGSDRFFYVGYIQEDGVIHHLGPKFIDSSTVGERFLFRTGYEVVPPFGPELILVIASRDPIFSEPRPSAEQASSYLQALRARLAEAPQNDAVSDTLLIQTTR